MEIKNRKARYNYFILKEIECGIVLTGTEIKSLRKGSADIKDCYAKIKNDEAFLINMYIAKYDETYIEEIYYKLALAYEDTDLNKSKEYAEHIKKEFSNSIYNNSKISQIISK